VEIIRSLSTLAFSCRDGMYMETKASSYWYGFKLAGNIPDQSSGVKGNIGVIAYLVKYGDGRCGLDCFAYVLIHEDRLDVLC
jgi:hypothetical protein